jgi:hypothetical protein
MKIYDVECWAVITLAEQDMEKAGLRGAALIKDNPHLIYVRAVHERDFEAVRADRSSKNSQQDSIGCNVTDSSPFLIFQHTRSNSRR